MKGSESFKEGQFIRRSDCRTPALFGVGVDEALVMAKAIAEAEKKRRAVISILKYGPGVFEYAFPSPSGKIPDDQIEELNEMYAVHGILTRQLHKTIDLAYIGWTTYTPD